MNEPTGLGRPRRASDEAAHAIVDAVLDADRARYHSEADALYELGVGRGTYREALRFLERLGVVEVRSGPGGGPARRMPDAADVASVIALWMESSDASLRSVLQARGVIEPGIARLAAEQATADQVAAMAAALDDVERGLGDIATFSVAYRRYWDLLAEAAANALLSLLGPALRTIVNSGGFAPDEIYRARILDGLREIHAAVADRRPADAEAATRALDIEFTRRLEAGYPRQIERPVPWRRVDQSVHV